MKIRQKRPRDAGSVIERRRADGSIRYVLKWRGYTESTQATSKSEALEMLKIFRAKAESGELERMKAEATARGQQPTLREWSKVYLAQHVSQDPDKLATRRAYEGEVRLHILPTLGDRRLGEITWPVIREMMQAHRAAGLSIRTIQLAWAVLRLMLDAAIEDGVMKSANPMLKFSKLKLGDAETGAEVARRSALTARQVGALLGACRAPDLKIYIAAMASCGLRPGECVGLRWRDVDLKASVIHVRGAAKKAYARPGEKAVVWMGKPKTKSSVRVVAIGPTLSAMLAAERERQESYQTELLGRDPNLPRVRSLLPADACVFPVDPASPPVGLTQPADPHNMSARFVRAAARIGLKASPHWLRHTHLSHAIEGGLSLADTAARAGHSNVLTTARVYVHAVSESQGKAAAIGDSLLAPAPENVERLDDVRGN
jgi:integrase